MCLFQKTDEMYGKIWGNHGNIWENHGKHMGESWGNHGKMMRHMWIEWTIDGTCRTCSIKNNPQRCRTYPLTPDTYGENIKPASILVSHFSAYFWGLLQSKSTCPKYVQKPKKSPKNTNIITEKNMGFT